MAARRPGPVIEKAFILAASPAEARRFFEAKRTRRRFGVGVEEAVDALAARYRPLVRLDVYREMLRASHLPGRKPSLVGKHLACHLDLVHGHVHRLRDGVVESSAALAYLPQLTQAERAVLDELLIGGPASVSAFPPPLVERLLDAGLALTEKSRLSQAAGIVSSLAGSVLDLVSESPTSGVSRGDEYRLRAADVFPAFDDDRFDLESRLAATDRLDDRLAVEEATLSADAIADTLSSLAGFTARPAGFVYLPFYECRYRNEAGELRFKTHIPLKVTDSP